MALLTSYGSTNCVVESGLVVRYSKSPVYGQWQYAIGVTTVTVGKAWQYTRTAAKSYRYVGMTYSAAKSCKADMIAKYTRTVKTSEWDALSESTEHFGESSSDNASILMADVALVCVGGVAWDVVINVNEVDTRLRESHNGSPDALFASETDRTYGPDGGDASDETETTGTSS